MFDDHYLISVGAVDGTIMQWRVIDPLAVQQGRYVEDLYEEEKERRRIRDRGGDEGALDEQTRQVWDQLEVSDSLLIKGHAAHDDIPQMDPGKPIPVRAVERGVARPFDEAAPPPFLTQPGKPF